MQENSRGIYPYTARGNKVSEGRRERAAHLRIHLRDLALGPRGGCRVCSPYNSVGGSEVGITGSNHSAFVQ